ncbi:MAG: TlpA family protein disulfide reductase [Nitrospinae bacterium]|nr:TlpA family protein disulfide reductase [Nitrospinota bacterium]
MNTIAEEKIRWIPFGALALAMVIATGFWKIEKNREEPLQPLDVPAAQSQGPAGAPSKIAPPQQSKMEGKPAPDFTLPGLDGKNIKLSSYRGKMVFLNIWATWCPPCREEMPSMQKLHEHFKGKDFVMLTVSIDEKKEDVAAFMKELGLTFPVALDPEQKVSAEYGITGVPETFLIDKNGTVLHHLIGPGDWSNPGIVSAFEGLVSRPAKVAKK